MNAFFQICLYLLVILGLILTTITLTESKYKKRFEGKYIRKKNDKEKINVCVNIKGTSLQGAERIRIHYRERNVWQYLWCSRYIYGYIKQYSRYWYVKAWIVI